MATTPPRNREELISTMSEALNLYKNRSMKDESKRIIQSTRLLTDNPEALNPGQIYVYRNRKSLPESFLQGAAVAQQLLGGDFSSLSFNFYQSSLGYSFDSIHYYCDLVDSDDKKYFDAHVKVLYRGVYVNPKHGAVEVDCISFSDTTEYSNHIEFDGPGISVQKRPKVREYIVKGERKQNKETTYAHSLFLDSKASQETQFSMIKCLKKAFRKSPCEQGFLEKAGLRIGHPVSSITLELSLPKTMFKHYATVNRVPVSTSTWINERPAANGSNRIIPPLEDSTVARNGIGHWKWQSSKPPLFGNFYALCYNPSDITHLLKEESKQ